MRNHHLAHARALAGAAALLAVVATGACTTEREKQAERQAERAPAPLPQKPTTDIDTVKEEPQRFYDKAVRVTGEVDKIYSDRAFRLEGTGWAFDDDITVLMKKPLTTPIKNDDELVVSGTVRRLVVADVERDLGWDLSPEIEVELKERPVLVADSVRRVAKDEDIDKVAEKDDDQVNTVTELLAVKDQKGLAGQKIDLGRETVQAVAGKGLWVGPTTTEKVFILPAMMPKDIVVGDIITASGTLREVPANALDTWNLPKEMAEDLDKVVYVEAITLREVAVDGDERRN